MICSFIVDSSLQEADQRGLGIVERTESPNGADPQEKVTAS
jgi:hypothetical protein